MPLTGPEESLPYFQRSVKETFLRAKQIQTTNVHLIHTSSLVMLSLLPHPDVLNGLVSS
jgi:hypothetical protein